MKTMLLAMTILTMTACDNLVVPDEWPAYQNIIPESRKHEAAEWILKVVAVANPHSDEEPEDNILQAEKTAAMLFGVPTLGMRTNRNGVWVFVPVDLLPPSKREICERWAGKEAK